MDYNGETFRDCRVRLDHNQFTDCQFENVIFEYGGGPISLSHNTIGDCSFFIDGDLGRGLEVLRRIGHNFGGPTVKAFVDGISAMLRKSVPVETFHIG